MSRVAIVVPCFDDPHVEEAVASALRQEPCELVVIDDGSTDPAGLAALDRVRTRGVRVVRQDNQGLSAARMTGVRETDAPLIFPLDSDDVLADGAIARLADALERDAGAAVAFGDVQSFGAASSRFDNRRKALDPWWITYKSTLPGTSMVRRTSLLAAGGWQLDAGGYEDWDLWMAMTERGMRAVHVPGVAFRYRIHAGGSMWTQATDEDERLRALLAGRHRALFDDRAAAWRRSVAPARIRLLFPLVRRLPVPWAHRRRLLDLVSSPGHIVVPRVRALVGRVRGSSAPRRGR